MKPIQGYHLIRPEDLSWRPSNVMRMTMKTIKVRDIVQEDSVLGRFRGGELRRLAIEALKQESRVRFDFNGIVIITQSAADEFVGRLRRYDEPLLDRVAFANCSEDVSHMLQWASASTPPNQASPRKRR